LARIERFQAKYRSFENLPNSSEPNVDREATELFREGTTEKELGKPKKDKLIEPDLILNSAALLV
jgi:hypothetical protein